MQKNKPQTFQTSKNILTKKDIRILKYLITSIVIWGILFMNFINNYIGYSLGFISALLIMIIAMKPRIFLKALSFIKFKFDDYVGSFVIWLIYG